MQINNCGMPVYVSGDSSFKYTITWLLRHLFPPFLKVAVVNTNVPKLANKKRSPISVSENTIQCASQSKKCARLDNLTVIQSLLTLLKYSRLFIENKI